MGKWFRWAFVLVGCLLGIAPAFANLIVGNMALVSEQRIGRTLFVYTFHVDLTNTGGAVTGATATVTSSSSAMVILDGDLSFGDVVAGATVTSLDTFSFQQDRSVQFDLNALTYTVTATPVSGDTTPPQLSLATSDGIQVDTPDITITGTASDETGLAGVTVNGIAAVLSGNTFALSVALEQGANQITVIATDTSGNNTALAVTVNRIEPLPPPQISGFNPVVVTEGAFALISGDNLAARFGAPPLVILVRQGGGTVSAPVGSFDATSIGITIPPSAVTSSVSVTVNGQTAISSSALTINRTTDFTLSPSPASIGLLQGGAATLDIRIDSATRFPQMVDLAVTGLPMGVAATLEPATISIGQSSALTLRAPADLTAGPTSFQITATAIIDGAPVTKTAMISLDVQPATTSFIGRTVVADPEQTPLAGVTATLLGIDDAGNITHCDGQTQSDAAGNFAFIGLPAACVGIQLIRYDGATVTSPAGEYAGVDLAYEIRDGQVVESPVLVHLPRIDNGETVMVVQNNNTDQTFRFSSIPNLSITVYAGTTLTMADGSRPDPFPLIAVQVPIDRLPDEMPAGGDLTSFIVAFQPANGESSQPIAITFPNTVDTPPATTVALMTLDPTQGKMVSYGTGTVSDDGLRIDPDPDPARPGKRYGLVHFDWHGPSGPAPNQIDPCPNGPCGGDPVHFASGLVVDRRTDIAIPAPGGGISIRRTYRTGSFNAGPFGVGGFDNYSYFLDVVNPSPTKALINYIVPAGNQFPFANMGNGIFTNRTEPTLRGVVMKVNGDGTIDVTFKDGTRYHFVPGSGVAMTASVLESITDPNGNKTTLVRNPSESLEVMEIIDSVGRRLKLSYDANGFVTQVVDPIGRTVTYTYTPLGRLETVTDPEGGVTRYSYVIPAAGEISNELESITDARGVVVARNFFGLVYGPACGGATGWSDDDLAARPQAERDACLNDPRTVRDQRVWKQTAADGGTMHLRYTLSNPGLPLSPAIRTAVTDALGHTTAYRFSTQGQPLDVTDPVGQTLNFGREPGGNLLLSKLGSASCEFCGDVSGGDFSQTRDENGNILTRTDALGNVTTFAYDPRFNKPTSIVDAQGHTTLFSYDTHGNLLSATDADGNATTFAYDSRGLPVRVTDAAGNPTALNYDAFGNLVKTMDALGNVTRFSYDAVGRLVETVDPLGRHTKLAYDKLDRIVSQTDPKGQITAFSYDSVGNLLSVTDAKGHTVSFTYDVMKRVASRTDALGQVETFEYDLNGNLIKATDRRGQISYFEYDRLNRLVKQTYADGSTVLNSYETRSRLIRIDDSAGGVQTFEYDDLGRLTRETGANGAIDYQYDALGRTTSTQVAGQSAVSYSYDPVGNLLRAASPQAQVDFIYDKLNRRTGLQRGNGVNTTRTYDALSRVLSIIHENTGGVIDRQTYSYDNAGNRKSLENILGAPYITESAAAQYDVANRLIQRGDTTYTYDNNGNRTGKTNPQGTTTYAWDSRNRLTSITEPNGTVTRFTYDALNNLISQQVAGPAGNLDSAFLVDDLTNVIRQTDSGGAAMSILTGRGIDDHLVVTQSDGSQDYVSRDSINSTTATTDSSGILKQGFSYEPYGQSSITKTTFPIQYTGRLAVADGLYYYRARFYDPETGSFLSEDPLGLVGGINYNAYVSNNPVNRIDPTGEFSPLAGAAGGFVAGFIGSGVGTLLAGGDARDAFSAAFEGGLIGGSAGFLAGLCGGCAASVFTGISFDLLVNGATGAKIVNDANGAEQNQTSNACQVSP